MPRLDEEDARLLNEAAGVIDPVFVGPTDTTKLGIIDSQDNLSFSRVDTFLVGADTITSYPFLGMIEGDTIPLDTDLDGMPDAWETAHNLNPQDPADRNLCTLSALNAGYTNLEFFLNGGDGELSNPIPEARPVPEPKTALPMINEQTETKVLFDKGALFLQKDNEIISLTGQKIK